MSAPVLLHAAGTIDQGTPGSLTTWIGRLAALSPASCKSARRTDPHEKPLANCAHSPTSSPTALVTVGRLRAAGRAEAATRKPDDPVSTITRSMSTQVAVPGWQTRTVTKGELIDLSSVPVSTRICATLLPEIAGAATASTPTCRVCSAGGESPPPPPQAASRASVDSATRCRKFGMPPHAVRNAGRLMASVRGSKPDGSWRGSQA